MNLIFYVIRINYWGVAMEARVFGTCIQLNLAPQPNMKSFLIRFFRSNNLDYVSKNIKIPLKTL